MEIKSFTGDKIPFTNDGDLSLFFMGCGTAFSKKLFQNNLLIIKGEDHLLVDFGNKSPDALCDLGHAVTDVRNIFITHSHADHIGGLEEIALMGRYFARRKPTMVITEEYQKMLWEESLKGGCAYSEANNGDYLTFEHFFDVNRPVKLKGYPRDTYEANVGSINLKIFRTRHIPSNVPTWKECAWSTGMIIDDRVMYTSDTLYDEELITSFDKMFNLEAIFHDCQFFTGGVHASLNELNNLPPEIKSRTYIMHYSDQWRDYMDLVREYGFADAARQWKFYNFTD